jgi:hypothetical protein
MAEETAGEALGFIYDYRFEVTIDGEQVPVMKVEGLGFDSHADCHDYLKLTRACMRGDSLFRNLVGAGQSGVHDVTIDVADALRFELPRAHARWIEYSELDKGGNKILLETVTFEYQNSKIEDV